jgi:hypothetical protein
MIESTRYTHLDEAKDQDSITDPSLPGAAPSLTNAGGEHPHAPSPPLQSPLPTGMFSINVRNDSQGRVVIMGRPTRKHANALLNIPICQETRRRLDEQFVGSLSMATSALIEWALDELKRQAVALEVRPQR